ncbi:type VI secretion system-associated protein [Halopseudomonas oceani]|uniref:Type VI secretion system contractile sheath small subunit n=1 Tax=Halopseudomonas oceani TaxID=1708783 RepID=A0A2P4EX36_9GAMM|nr:type VI secretion system contractile sheath small subunit [Halopseudomonas oceani]POB04540.1 type VI secretion system contractile sheath small subunit [Halopseudomonas oceani]GGE39387.1 type VI secretion system-associated protein [Halopseudomonas oceani]
MAKDSTVAPRERINVTFTPNTGDQQEDVELPLKLMVLGDFTLRQDERSVEQRKPILIDKTSFEDVLAKQDLHLNFNVANRLQDDDSDSALAVELNIGSMRDFNPASIVEQVPELRQLMELREALVSLKGPLGNTPAFRQAIEALLRDDQSREQVLTELGLAPTP